MTDSALRDATLKNGISEHGSDGESVADVTIAQGSPFQTVW